MALLINGFFLCRPITYGTYPSSKLKAVPLLPQQAKTIMASTEKTRNAYSSSSAISDWIQECFKKRECIRVVPVSKDSSRCGCGRHLALHYYFEGEEDNAENQCAGWNVARCTASFPTDAYGTLTFRSGKGFRKARYIRADFDTDPADLWRLMVDVWGFEAPTLVITIQDAGEHQPPLSPGLIKAIKKGLSKAARTGSTWIITSGFRTGVNEATAAFGDSSSWRNNKQQRVQVIGFAPWGLVRGADPLVGTNSCSVRYCGLQESSGEIPDSPQGGRLLGEGHSAFVLVDDGTKGGQPSTKAQMVRRRFEDFLKAAPFVKRGGSRVMMVCLMVNGKRQSLDAFCSYVSKDPAVPVVTVARTGGVADCISTIYDMVNKPEQPRPATLHRRLLRHIQGCLEVDKAEAHDIFNQLTTTVNEKADNITVYRTFDHDGGQENELDVTILNGLLKGLNLSATEKLNLTVVWDREDLAREILNEVGNAGLEWPDESLDEAMTNALVHERVDFVHSLLSAGVAVDRFLTIARLEKLYNSSSGPSNTLQFIVRDVVKNTNPNYKYRLPHIGLVVEKLMGNGYRSAYCRKDFRKRHKLEMMLAQRSRSIPAGSDNAVYSITGARSSIFAGPRNRPHFAHPYHELFIWAVLTNRNQLAMQFWQHGQEQLAKALVGSRLYASLAKEAEEDYLEMEVCQQLQRNAKEFKNLACELLAQCYETDDDLTLQLLTYELRQFNRSTCISLAASARNEAFVAHQSCQLLLADLWLGGLRLRKNANLKVFASILFPPLIAALTFKSKEELQLQAQTAEESGTYRTGDARKKSWAERESTSVGSSDDDIASMDDVESMFSEEISKQARPDCVRENSDISLSVHYAAGSAAVDMSLPLPEQYRKASSRMSLEAASPGSQSQRRESKHLYVSHTDDSEPVTIRRSPKPFKRFATAFDLTVNVNQLGPRSFDKPPVLQRKARQRQQLELSRKILEFYSAPITAFWSFTIAYAFFLSCFTYTVLVRTPLVPHWPEYYVIAFLATFSADQIRKIILQEPQFLRAKLRVFSSSAWDSCSVIACMMFFLALVFRLDPVTLSTGRVLYCLNIVFWYLYVLKIMNVNSVLNPYIHMYGKMVLQLFLLSSILFIILASFGIFRQSIDFPNEKWRWSMLRDIGYKPYSYLYGSLYPDEITECEDEGKNCSPGIWLTPLFMTIYLLLAMVVFMNMMVAAFSHIFNQVNARAQEIAKFESYRQVMEFEQQPFLAPPLSILAHFYMIIKYLYKRFCKKERNYRFEHSLKLFLAPQEKEKLHEFEHDCLNELLQKKAERKANTLDERLQCLTERLDAMSSQVDYLQEQTHSHHLALMKLSGMVAQTAGRASPSESSLDTSAPHHALPNALLSPLRSASDFENDSRLSETATLFQFTNGKLAGKTKPTRLPQSPLSKETKGQQFETHFPMPPKFDTWHSGSDYTKKRRGPVPTAWNASKEK